jgi:chromosomal replication initiation ATPase DnaA
MNYYQEVYDNSVDKAKALMLLSKIKFENTQRTEFFYSMAKIDKDILTRIALSLFKVSEEQFKLFKKKGGRRDAVTARYCIMWFMRKNLGYTDTIVGKVFTQDRTTVIHALKTISNILDTDKEFRQVFNTFMSVAEVAILRNRTKEPVTFNKLKFTIKNESNEQSTS